MSAVQPKMLSQLNERAVIRWIQRNGPCSRAEATRSLGITAPTVSKAVASLLRCGLLEEIEGAETGRGRPAKKLRLATARVLGLVIDADQCRLVAAGLDGTMVPEAAVSFPTPPSYDLWLAEACQAVESLVGLGPVGRDGVANLGLGISMPGLIDYRKQEGLLSPNVPITDGQSPGKDLGRRLGIPSVMLQETHGLCLAERQFGAAAGLDDFAMLDATTGLGLGVVSGGRIMTGRSGLAGEIGHIPFEQQGRLCGCGRNGCLETVASDSALAREISQLLGHDVSFDELIDGPVDPVQHAPRELERALNGLAVTLATVINLFNPSTLFVHARTFEIEPSLFSKLVGHTRGLALGPSFRECEIVKAAGSKRQGAVAGIIEYLTDSLAPDSLRESGVFTGIWDNNMSTVG